MSKNKKKMYGTIRLRGHNLARGITSNLSFPDYLSPGIVIVTDAEEFNFNLFTACSTLLHKYQCQTHYMLCFNGNKNRVLIRDPRGVNALFLLMLVTTHH